MGVRFPLLLLNFTSIKMGNIIHDLSVKQINWCDERFYTIDGKTYIPSVTYLLDSLPKGPWFNEWLKSVGQNADLIRDRAAKEGSAVHNAIERFLEGEEIFWAGADGSAQYNLVEWKCILRFSDFWNTHKPKLIHSEIRLISEKLFLAGTCDLICEIDGETWLIDIKTSNQLSDSYYLQLCAYVKIYEGISGKKIDRIGVIWLKAKTRGADKSNKKIQGHSWQLVEYTDIESGWETLKHLQEIWRFKNPDAKPKNLIYPDRIKIGRGK